MIIGVFFAGEVLDFFEGTAEVVPDVFRFRFAEAASSRLGGTIFQNLSKLVQICSNLFKLVQTCLSMFKLV